MPHDVGTTGHVFIIQGDLTRIACDAWLLPTDAYLSVTEPWHDALGDAVDRATRRLRVAIPAGWGSEVLSAPLVYIGTTSAGSLPWMTCVGLDGPNIRAQLDATEVFIREAARSARSQPSRRRAKPLLALPLVGTGAGGTADYKGEASLQLVERLHQLAADIDVDIVLVAWTSASFAGAQAARRFLQESVQISCWDEIGEFVDRAQGLGRRASSGDLVLFLGAGLGVSAGLPLWDELLAGLASKAELDPAALQQFDVVDQASLIERRLDRSQLHDEIAETMRDARYGLGHALLACLPVREVVTTNYDNLFEDAAAAAGTPLAVLPYQPNAAASRWILKLHGSLGKNDIVLTRDDYLRIPDNRGALAGIVQAMLITREMLFVGYSLRDHDFHQIAHEVRKAVRGSDGAESAHKFGTALTFSRDGLLQELWPDLNFVSFGAADRDASSAGRLVEIFLDAVLASAATNPGYLLDDSFRGLLGEDELILKDQLLEIRATATRVGDSPAAVRVLEFLRSVGGDQ